MDRNILGVLKPTIQNDLHFSETDFGNIILLRMRSATLGWGGLPTRSESVLALPPPRSFGALLLPRTAWSPLSQGSSLPALCSASEGGNFPACIKTIATWFPVRDRALATGIFNSGSNIGAMLAPLIGALVVSLSGWQAAFYVTGAIGLVWVVYWLMIYRSPAEHPRVSPGELAYINSDPEVVAKKVPWAKLLAYPGTWVYIIGGVLTNPAWWFYNNWVPSFPNSKFHVSLFAVGLPLVVIYLLTDVGSIAGGWVSSALIKRGMDVFTARKVTLCSSAQPVLCRCFWRRSRTSMWAAVVLIGIAMAAHQGFSANLFTLVSDTMPRDAVPSAVRL